MRGDLEMPAGKLAAQAGHAFLSAFNASLKAKPNPTEDYLRDGPGTKVVLCARDLLHLLTVEDRARQAGIPCALITDHGHILPPHFDGNPIITAIGIGPATREEVRGVTQGLALVP